MQEMTTVQVIKHFFGLKPGQTLTDFMAEMKGLSAEDKKELAELAAAELKVTIKA